MMIPKNAFRFCRITMTVIAWLSFILKSKELILLAFLLLLFSAILKIKRAPLVFLYANTVEKVFASKKVDLDEKGIRFAHTLGSVLSGMAVVMVYAGARFAWWWVFAFAVLKTTSMFGLCPGEKLYKCMKGGCCSILRK
jgi:hypothetical protein